MPKQIAVAEPPVTVFGKGRVIGDAVGQVEAAEPAIRKVQMDLLAEPPFRSDAHAIAEQQPPNHQLGVDRRAAYRAVERRQVTAQIAKLNEPVDRPQQVVRRDVVLKRELAEQRTLRHPPRPHHRNRPS
jgi:hypothetical protein